jgi:hypothetical protein
MKQALIAIVLIAAAAVVAHYHVAAQRYFPIVHISSPDGLSYLAVMDPTPERQACGASNDRYLKPIKQLCKECRIDYARCERSLDGLEAKLHDGVLIPYPAVDAPGLRMAVVGDANAAQMACAFIAAGMVKQGIPAAACVRPNRPPPAR